MTPFSPDSLAAHVHARLAGQGGVLSAFSVGTPSAVLVPLFEQGGEAHVWLLRKRDDLRKHGGQVALPGGKTDPTDGNARETALREAEEEIALPRTAVQIIGELPPQLVLSGFVVTPVVAIVREPFTPRPDPGEVARVFTAPLAPFADEGELHEVTIMSFKKQVPSREVDGELVWGATYSILQRLARLLK